MVGDVFRIAAVGELFGQEIVNTFQYQQASANGTVQTDFQKLADAFVASVIPAWAACVSTDFTFTRLEVRNFPLPPVPLTGIDIDISASAGLIDDTANAPSVAVVIRRRTALLGRMFRGRVYFAAVANGDEVAGQVRAGALTTYWDALKTILVNPIVDAAPTSPSFNPVISTKIGPEGSPPTSLRTTIITRGDVDPVVRSQRRREIGVGV